MTLRERLAALKIGLGLDGVRGQIAGLVLASVIASQLIIAAAFLINRPDAPPLPQHEPQQLTVIAQLLARTAPAQRPPLIGEIASAFPWIELTAAAPAPAPEARPLQRLPAEAHELRHHLGPDYRITLGEDHRLSITLPDGDAIRARVPADHPHPPLWGSPWLLSLLIGAVSVALLGLWAARALAAPLSSFAAAAESFSLQTTGTPLPERGPAEIRSLARALNRMRERITTMIDERTKMLAAISHDLRTPITRLRLGLSMLLEEAAAARPEIASMSLRCDRDGQDDRRLPECRARRGRGGRGRTHRHLSFRGSGGRRCDPRGGQPVRLVACPETPVTAVVRPDALRRALENLIGNAVRYGTNAEVTVAVRSRSLRIIVEDDGPGIPADRREEAMRPFTRLDPARNQDRGQGVGLGLAIAADIARGHGGSLKLLESARLSGLAAELHLPL